MINLKYLDLVNARRSSTGYYMEMKQTLMMCIAQKIAVVQTPR